MDQQQNTHEQDAHYAAAIARVDEVIDVNWLSASGLADGFTAEFVALVYDLEHQRYWREDGGISWGLRLLIDKVDFRLSELAKRRELISFHKVPDDGSYTTYCVPGREQWLLSLMEGKPRRRYGSSPNSH